MINRRSFAALALGVSLLGLSGAARGDDAKLPVVASFSILGDMTKEIGGEHVAVTTLVGPGGDAHVFEPTPADAKALGGAKLLVTNGLHFESWLPRLVRSADFKGQTLVASTGVEPHAFQPGFDEDEDEGNADGHAGESHEDHDHHAGDTAEAGHEGHHHHGAEDPHAWQDLSNGVIYARNITDALKTADPENAADYEAKGAAYIAALKALDAEVREKMASIPEANRKVVTSHDAFGYFGSAYGIQFIAPSGISTEAEASAGDVARIIDQVRTEKIPAVFLENVSDPRLVQQIANETGAEIGGELYSDALSDASGPASTYMDMFRNNVSELLKALKTS